MVDALRLSTLQNRRCCSFRVDKARRSVSWTRHVGRARRIHHGLHEILKIGIAAAVAAAGVAAYVGVGAGPGGPTTTWLRPALLAA